MIEHRLGMREPIERRVCIHRPKSRPIFGHCRDVSSSGMFVRTFRSDLAVNSKVELITVWREGKVFRMHRVKAIVARVGKRGIGLMFADPDMKAVYDLLARLRGGTHGKKRSARRAGGDVIDIAPEGQGT